MENKEVKIIGLTVNKQLGILQACSLKFDTENRLTAIKGGVGEGKTTLQKSLQLGTQGSKTLTDKQLYGDVDLETQLLDGDLPVFVGCKSEKDGSLSYVLYTKDIKGKKVENPVIDSVKATPAKYLEVLQTELTWRMDKLTSENPTVQKNILLKLYQSELIKIGVIFDKKVTEYTDSILDKIEKAEAVRDQKDALRKQYGGIAEDLKARGFDPDRPDTIPDEISIDAIDQKIKEQEKQKTIAETKGESAKAENLASIKQRAAEATNECLQWNNKRKNEYEIKLEKFRDIKSIINENESAKSSITSQLNELVLNESLTQPRADEIIKKLNEWVINPEQIEAPLEPLYIKFTEDNKVITNDLKDYSDDALILINKIIKLKEDYFEVLNSEIKSEDTTVFDTEIEKLEASKKSAIENNKIVKAVDYFHEWRDANAKVVALKSEYVQMLAKIDTGVNGLRIIPDENGENIYLCYDGSYDPTYFNNPEKEYRKLSSYSGTQKPIICLLIQNVLLSKKPKALRYMYIDNIPIDIKTRTLIESMCKELDLRVFLNITGDFTAPELQNGEILVEGGEVFFN